MDEHPHWVWEEPQGPSSPGGPGARSPPPRMPPAASQPSDGRPLGHPDSGMGRLGTQAMKRPGLSLPSPTPLPGAISPPCTAQLFSCPAHLPSEPTELGEQGLARAPPAGQTEPGLPESSPAASAGAAPPSVPDGAGSTERLVHSHHAGEGRHGSGLPAAGRHSWAPRRHQGSILLGSTHTQAPGDSTAWGLGHLGDTTLEAGILSSLGVCRGVA